jgi:hypothetical protein
MIHCGGGETTFTPMKKPVAIALSTSSVSFQGQPTQFAYVVDQFTQVLIPIDTRRERLVDTAPDDDFDYSPLAIGGEPSAVAVDDEVPDHRIFVADQLNNQIIAYQIESNLSGDIASYKSVSLGGAKEGKSSRFIFKNSGATSSPSVTNAVVDPNVAQNESWKLTFKSDSYYELEGSKSGKQVNRVKEGETYVSDNGEVQFFISGSGERTTNGDEFFFSTFITRPLQLASSPVDLLVNDRKLYILTKNAASIIVFDLDTLSIDNTFPLPDAAAIPTKLFFHDDKIYSSNLNSGDVFVFDILAQTYTTVTTSLTGIRHVSADDDHLFLVQDSVSKLSVTNHSGSSVSTLILNDFGNFFFTANVLDERYGLVPNISGNVDVIDMVEVKRIDTDLKDKPEYIGTEFFDVGAVSKPQLISVDVTPNVSQGEVWQMVYSSTSETYKVTGSKSGLQTNEVVPGEPYTSDNGEISLRTRPSFAYPETNGDFFSFITLDPIDPILINNQGMAIGGIALSRISDGKPMAYIIQQTNGQVSIVDLGDFKVKKTL